MRRKRKRDAEIVQEMSLYMSSGVILCVPEERVEEGPASLEVEREAPPPLKVISMGVPSTDYRLPFQRYRPEKLDHYVGNKDNRDLALQWLKKWKVTMALQRPKRVGEAMMLLYGHVGTGKSTWARYIALQEEFSIATYTPGDGGAHDVQKLDFWLRSQPSRNLRGQPMAVILDDVDELFRACPAARSIMVNCPVIATAGPAPEAMLRKKCAKAILFSKLLPHDASKVVLRLLPHASEGCVKSIVSQADGDIRQLMLRSSLGLWNVAGATDGGETSFGRAQSALNRDDCLDEECGEDRQSQRVMHYNFHKCCLDETFLETYAGFLKDASTLDAISATYILPHAVRRWRGKKSEKWLDSPPMMDVDDNKDGNAWPAAFSQPEERPTIGAYAQREWISRKPTFKPGMQFACSLLVGKLGASLADEVAKPHSCGELLEEACLSASMRLAAQHVAEIAGYFENFV